MAGRPTKMHPERIEAILASIRNGAPRTDAAGAAGIHRDTLREWMRDPAFSEAVENAESEFVSEAVRVIAKAGEEQWQAKAWLLERRRHEDFGRRDRVDMAIDVRSMAAKLAGDHGLDADQVIAEAEAILARN